MHGGADVSISQDKSLPLSEASHEDVIKQAEKRADIKDTKVIGNLDQSSQVKSLMSNLSRNMCKQTLHIYYMVQKRSAHSHLEDFAMDELSSMI